MKITNKYTGRDVTSEILVLLNGTITQEEFETITLTPSK